MENRTLDVELRNGTGKGVCRQLRNQQLVPGIVYGKAMKSIPVVLKQKQLAAAVAGKDAKTQLLTVRGGGELDGSNIILADILRGTLKGEILHVDLHKVDMKEKVKVEVPVRVVGTAVGVREGGLLDLGMHTVQIECLPNRIPEHLDVDVADLALGQSLHVGDLQLSEGIKILDDPKAAVVSILGRAKEEAPAVE